MRLAGIQENVPGEAIWNWLRVYTNLCSAAFLRLSRFYSSASATTLTWTGGAGDGNINNPNNWSPAQARPKAMSSLPPGCN